MLHACSSRSASSISNTGVLESEPTMQNGFFGRWFDKEVNGRSCKVSTAPGAYLSLEVEGARELEVRFEKMDMLRQPIWAYQIDEQKAERRALDDTRIELPDTNVHQLKIIFESTDEYANRCDEERGLALADVSVSSGSARSSHQQKPVIAFYGDSITEGDCLLAAHTSPEHGSATRAYPWLLCELLQADALIAGYGGSGIATPGSFMIAEQALTHYSAGREAPRFDADLVVIEYGTNDLDVSPADFEAGYKSLLDAARTLHLGTSICCMIPFTQVHADSITRAVREFSQSDARIKLSCFETESLDLNFTDGLHPDAPSSELIAQALAEQLRRS